ncbi:MAG TPA: hypothetical protein ENG90_11110 [Gammaproteobacteria bacterium]|nr:hypothetical protein [Gammaproteobacteria bacterium]
MLMVYVVVVGQYYMKRNHKSGSNENANQQFVLLLTQLFDVDPGLYLALIFILHSVTMIVPFKLTVLIRGLAKTATMVILVNVALVAAWLIPAVTPFIGGAFLTTYLYSFIIGGRQWLRERENKAEL